MGAKTIGLSRDLLIHPGETIADILEERNITQKELARRAGVSEPFLCDVIRGRKDISKGLAKGLEYALGVKSSFWLNLQANYDAELLMLDEEDSIEEEERSVYVKMKEIVDCLKKQSKIEQSKTEGEAIISLRKYLRVSRLTGLESFATDGAFRISGKIAVDPDILGAWICMCQADSSERKLSRKFDKAKMEKLIRSLKQIMKNHEDPQPELVDLFADYGIDFSVAPNFKGAPIQGYLAKKNDENYQMVLTIRGSSADIFWFSLFHELGHIANGDMGKQKSYIDGENISGERENAADEFARNALIDPVDYDLFIQKNDFGIRAIKEFADSQEVPEYIVIGRLQHEEKIPWNRFAKYKLTYKWMIRDL